MHFVPSTVNRRTSSSQTASTADMSIKSDPEDHSNSFDPRAGADYIECVFHPANSMQPDDRDYEQTVLQKYFVDSWIPGGYGQNQNIWLKST